MESFRTLMARHRLLAGWLVAAALLMKVAIPAGFMPVVVDGTITVQICSGYEHQTVTVAIPGLAGRHDGQDQPGKAAMPCAFSGLTTPSLAATDAVLLAVAIAFIVAGVFRVATVSAAIRPVHLRPPTRGPPARI